MSQCLQCLQLGRRDADCENTHPDNLGHEFSTSEDSDKKEKN